LKEKVEKFLSSLSSSVKSGKNAVDKVGSKQDEGNKQAQILKQIRFENPVKSVGMKLFLMFFISILMFVLVVGMVSYQLSKGVIKTKVSEGSQQTITQAGKKLDFVSQTLEDSTLQIMLDKDLQDLLAALPNIKAGSYEGLEASRKISDKLNMFLFANKSIKSLQLYGSGGKLINMVGSGSTPTDVNVSSEAWFKQTMENNGKASWLDTKEKGYSGSASSFAIGRVLKNTTTSNTSAILLMEFGTEVLVNEIAAINLGPESEVGITNAANKYIATANNANLEKEAKIQLTTDQLAAAPGTSGSFENSDSRMVAYYKTKLSGWNLVAHMPVSSLVKDADKIFNFTLIIALVAALIAILIGIFVARSIGRPLILLRNLMQQGAKGNLTVRANYHSQDEIGQLGKSFDVMMQQITGLVQQTRLSAQQVLETAGELTNSSKTTAIAAREIATATDEISNGAAGLATESERGNELTQHIGTQMKKVIEANLEMGTAAADVQSSSEQGTKYMAELISKTNLTEEMIRSMLEKVDNLKESTRSIRKILDVLNNMTKQTNILSLNAAIEAARAGAAGKGFMVVADEIRKLADQSRQSIDIVGQITETIQKEIDETVKVLSNATPIFQEQIQSVKEADTIFKQVTTHMGDFIEQLSAVSDSISTLDQSQIVLSDAMTNVSAVAEQSLATSEEVASLSSEQLSISNGLVKLSDQLEHLSNSLKDTLSKFEVE
jgi:methyl-accepting chemotaxis protein